MRTGTLLGIGIIVFSIIIALLTNNDYPIRVMGFAYLAYFAYLVFRRFFK